MEQGARAPVKPGVNGRVFPGGWLACFSAVALGASVACATASEWAGIALTPEANSRILMLQSMRLEAVSTKLSFAPFYSNSVAMKVTTREVRLQVARASAKDAATTSETPAEKRKSTLLFGSLGKPVALSPVTGRWNRALEGLQSRDQNGPKTFSTYRAILSKVETKRRGLQIPQVNAMVNRMLSYQEDDKLWHTSEYWASPTETLSRGAGDCEDYAILKYALLRDLGVKDEDMRVVVLRDRAVRQYHAVLTVRHKNKWLVLDNRFSRVRFERDLPHYQALYTVNESGAWSHTTTGNKPVRLASRLKSAMK